MSRLLPSTQNEERDPSLLLRAALSLYLVLSVPFRISFVSEFKVSIDHIGFVLADLLCTFFFFADIISSFRRSARIPVLPITNFEETSGTISRDGAGVSEDEPRKPLEICSFWFRAQRRLYASVLATLPFEYVALFIPDVNVNYFMLNRMIVAFFLPGYAHDVSKILERRGLVKNISVHRAWKLFCAMALAGHWCGCVFFFVAKGEAHQGNEVTWAQSIGLFEISLASSNPPTYDIVMSRTIPGAYIQALYWAYITMITTGFGDIVPLSIPETICCVISMYIGVMITTCAIANLQLLMTNMDAAQTEFQNKMERIKTYMRYRSLPIRLQDRIISFYDYQWELLRGADETKFLTELPRSLQQQVSNYMCRDLISSLPMLRKANNALINALADSVENHIYSPNDDILRPGEQLQGPLLVSRGEIEVLNGSVVERKMQRFDRFAEESLFENYVSEQWVRSKTFCEVFLLSAKEFQRIINAQCTKEHIFQMKEIAAKIAGSAKKANKMFGSAEETIPLKGFKKRCSPNSPFRKTWDCVMLLVEITYIFTIGLNVMNCAQDRSFHDDAILLCCGYLLDCFFIVDTLFNFNYFMYLEEGLVIFDRERIRDSYIQKHSLSKEFVASLPFDLLGIFWGSRYFNILRIPKILHFSNIYKYQKTAEKLLVESKYGMSQALRRVIKLNFVMIVFCHWIGCIWYMCADLSNEINLGTNWREKDISDPSLAISHSDLGGSSGYLRSVYWAIVGMSTVGYGDIIPTNELETTASTFIILFGGLLLPAVVGGLAAYMGNLNKTAQSQKRKVTKALNYMQKHRMDKVLVDKVIRYYDYIWSRQGGVEEQVIMEELPGPLRERVAIFVNGKDIEAIPFFGLCDEAIKKHILSVLVPKVFLPNDAIICNGDIGKEMYMIENGRVVVGSSDMKITYCVLTKGDYFGEGCLLSARSVRLGNVYALTYCDCFVLSRDDFISVMSSFVAYQRISLTKSVASTVSKKAEIVNKIEKNFREYPKVSRTMGDSKICFHAVAKSMSRARFHPDSKFRLVWSIVMLVTSIYNAWVVPFRIAFESSFPFLIVDWPLDFCLLVDIYLNCFDFSYIYHGELVTDKEHIMRHYIHGRFLLDMITAFPSDVFCYYFLKNDSKGLFVLALLRIPKLFRIGRSYETFSNISRSLEENHVRVAPIHLVGLLSGVCFVAHWAACGFFAFARWKHDQSLCNGLDEGESVGEWGNEYAECMWIDTWIEKQIINGKVPFDGGDVIQHYIRAFHWALPTLVVVVIGDVVPITSSETLYAFIWMVVGVTINATIIGSIANIVSNLETDSAEYTKRVDAIKHFMHLHHVELKLQDRVDHFMKYLWSAHGGVTNDGAFIGELPSTLQMTILHHTQLSHIKNCPFFDICSIEIIKRLAMCLQPLVFSSEDVLIQYGDMGQEMFFLEKGTVEVVSGDGKTVFANLNHGAFFGETGLFFKTKRSTTIRAITFCEVLRLDKWDLDNELRQCDFDLSHMLNMFTDIKDSNTRRNQALAVNLSTSKKPGTKLNKIVDYRDIVTTDTSCGIFMPNSNFRAVWEILGLLFTVFFAVNIPYRIAFIIDEAKEDSYPWLAVDFIIDIFFLADIYFRYKMFPIIKNGSLIVEIESIQRHYRQNWMFWDVLSCIPLEVLAVFYGKELIFAFRLVHLFRIFRLESYFKTVEHYINLWNIRISAASNLLVTTFFYYVLINHWCACGWFILHRYVERDTELTWATSDCPGGEVAGTIGCLSVWDETLGKHNVCDGGFIARCYIRSFYFVITTISTVGYGDISPVTEVETLYEDVVVLVGACIFAGIIGAFTAYLSHSDTSGQNAFELKMQKLQEYMKYRHLPVALQNEILLHHHNKWRKTQILHGRVVMSILPVPLQMDLSFAVLESVVMSVPILSRRSLIVQKRIAHALSLQVCSIGAVVYTVGDIGFDIYFVGSGLVKAHLPKDLSLLDAEGKAAADRVRTKADAIGTVYRPGNHFGESCLVGTSGVRQETIVAKTITELYLINKDGIDCICRYMSVADKKQLYNDLIKRNGSTWHSFDEDTCDSSRPTARSPKRALVSSPSPKRDKEKTMRIPEPPSHRKVVDLRWKRAHNAYIPPKKEKVRLRSFSAEASKEAMEKMVKQSNHHPSVASIAEEGEAEISANDSSTPRTKKTGEHINQLVSAIQQGKFQLGEQDQDSGDEDDEDEPSTPELQLSWMQERRKSSNGSDVMQ